MRLNPKSEEAYKLLHEGTLAFARAEQQGIRVDTEYITSAKGNLTKRIDRLEQKIYDTKFYKHWKHSKGGKEPNIYSAQQLAHFLYKVKKLKPIKTSTDLW